MLFKLEVCSLEQSKRFAELGITQRRQGFQWRDSRKHIGERYDDPMWGLQPKQKQGDLFELQTNRQAYINEWGQTIVCLQYMAHYTVPMSAPQLCESFAAFTVCELGEMIGANFGLPYRDKELNSWVSYLGEPTFYTTEAHARAAQLIYLIETFNLTVDIVNDRLKPITFVENK